ncbi:domain found in IF2B/IF5-domain-containing protein [Aspergillus egyptiacus]|nr:domain found in IF2B/IF5-domain-containing protein [Aspergillus egyptiacus]
MAETAEPSTQKQRKSVAFSEGTVIMDTNGEVTQKLENPAEEQVDKAVDEVTDLFKGLSKKKKTKKPKDAEAGDEEAPAAADGEFDPTALKKKKKKPKKVDAGDFEAKLAEAGIAEKEAEEKEPEIPEGDLEAGTGIWAHDAAQPIPYSLLVSRFFSLIQSHHPDLLSSGTKSYKIPPPQCLREGNRRTIFANIADICKRMKRSDDHVMQFLFAELGTSGSVDGSRRLVIKGRFQQKQIENVLRRYIVEYVTCKTCRSPDTELNKGENRLYFVTCNSCGSRRSVAAIKTGFRGQVGRRKRQG